VLLGRFREGFDGVHRLFEFLHEPGMFLIAPGIAEAMHLGAQEGDPFAQVAVELAQVLGEVP
jgi:hypothetical protein